ncbi:cyclic nucleotide-binding domain-containing protein [Sporomusa aerivorans]|uniref:cyclic nucleotide-binding domain-containing protein n=1 Tax=Sporomusa aerivorans TaxID=204936 RepID=UPI00352B795D
MTNVVSLSDKSITIGIATTPQEKKEIFRFRYHIYAKEIGHRLASVDHRKEMLCDELDEFGLLLNVKTGTNLIGTVRVNIGRVEDFPPNLAQNFLLDRFQTFSADVDNLFGYASKGMISPDFRHSAAHFLLATTIYELYCENRIQFGFLNCNSYLLPFHEHYGYRRYTRNWVDPDYGLQIPLVLLIDDIAYLQTVNSPILNVAYNRTAPNDQTRKWFYREFPEAAKVISNRAVAEDAYWAYLSKCLQHSPHKAIPVLHGIPEPAAKRFVHSCGAILKCHTGEPIITCRDSGNELNILLAGRLETSDGTYILPGQFFGEVGLVNRTKHTSNVFASTDVEILVLSFQYFKKFSYTYPDISRKILQNLAATGSLRSETSSSF